MSEKRRIRRAVPVVVLTMIAAGAAFVVGVGPQATDASWTVTKSLAITATAVNPARPTALACPGSGLLASAVPFTWTAPPGAAPTGYTLKWTGVTTGSSTWPTTSGSVTSPLGSIIVSVYADYGPWQSAAGLQTRTINGIIFVGWTCT